MENFPFAYLHYFFVLLAFCVHCYNAATSLKNNDFSACFQ